MTWTPWPARARSTANLVASYTASTSFPSTVTPGTPYAFAFSARSLTANCFSGGVEYAQRLYSAITTRGTRCTAAKLRPSWKVPVDVAPSPIVADPPPPFAAQLEGQGDARHDGDHVSQVRNLAQIAPLEVVEMDVQLAPARRALGLGHVLAQDLDRLRAHHQHRAQVTDQGGEDIPIAAAVEGIRRRDGLPLLAERAEQAPDDLALPVQGDEPLLQRPREPQVAIDLEQLVARETGRGRRGLGRRSGAGCHDVNCSGRPTPGPCPGVTEEAKWRR